MPEWLVNLFAQYGYAAVFVGIFLENTGVPVPGETLLLAGGALAHAGRLSLGAVMACAAAAAVCGDNLGFLIGRRGGRALAERYGPTLGLSAARLAQFDQFFARHGPKTVFVARFVTGLRVFCAVLAGASAMPWPRFLLYNASGAVAWSVVVASVGYAMAKSWATLERWVGGSGLAALAVFLALAGFAVLRSRRRKPAGAGS